MSEETLEQKIAKRKDQAMVKQIGPKAFKILEQLRERREVSHRLVEYRVTESNLELTAHYSHHSFKTDCDGGYKDEWVFDQDIKIKYRGELVFEGTQHNYRARVHLYIPGKWEKTIDELYTRAQETEKERVNQQKETEESEAKRKKQSEEDALRKKWKL